MESKYARKQEIKKLATQYIEEEWEVLCRDLEFVKYLTGDTFDLAAARKRGEALVRPRKTMFKPVIKDVPQANGSLTTIGDAFASLEGRPSLAD